MTTTSDGMRELMRLSGYIMFAAVTRTMCSAALQAAVAAEPCSPQPVVAQKPSTNIVVSCSATNGVPVKIVYPDIPASEFCLEEQASELANTAAQGVHVKNGHALVVVRIPTNDGEYSALAKLRAKFRALEFLRKLFPGLSRSFEAPCRVLFCEKNDSGSEYTCVVSFKLADLNSRK